MSERASNWVAEAKGDRQPKRQSVRSTWKLLAIIAAQADEAGVYRDGIGALASQFGCTDRYVRQLMDRLEAGEYIERRPQYGKIAGRSFDAIVIAPEMDQTVRRPMRTLPKDLRPESDR